MNRISIVDDAYADAEATSVLFPRFSSSSSFARYLAAFITFAASSRPALRFVEDPRDKKIAASYPSKRYFCIRFVLVDGAYASANAHKFPGRCLHEIVPELTDFFFPVCITVRDRKEAEIPKL